MPLVVAALGLLFTFGVSHGIESVKAAQAKTAVAADERTSEIRSLVE